MVVGTKQKRLDETISAYRTRDIFPLDAPGLSLPGPDFVAAAESLGGEIEFEGKGKKRILKQVAEELQELYRQALYDAGTYLPITLRPGKKKTMLLVPGHRWSEPDPAKFGPRPSDAMVLGKMCGQDETAFGRNLIGPSGKLLLESIQRLNIKGAANWYITNVVKCEHPESSKTSTLKAGWIEEFKPLLQQELRLVRPKYILCLGADAVKALLGKEYSVSGMEGRVVEYKYPVSREAQEHWLIDDAGQGVYDENDNPVMVSDEPEYATALVMCCVHPAYVLGAPEAQQQLDFALARWGQLVQGVRFDTAETDIDHRFIDDLESLQALAYEIEHCPESYESPGVQVIAVDAEWHGEHPQNAGSYLRSIQISWAHKRAAYIAINKPGGKNAFQPHWKEAIKILRKICKSNKRREVRIVGQFLNADLEWLIPAGLDLRAEFKAPADYKATRRHGGFDTGLAAHAIEETGEFKLESMAMRYTTCPPYHLKLQKWKEDYCRAHNMKAKDLEGYGMCPTKVLWPYGAYDADATRRLYVEFQQLLDCDHFGHSCRKAFWISQRAAPAVLEIHQTGLCVDRERMDRMTEMYMHARDRLADTVRKWARWDGEDKKQKLNLNSPLQIREFLFGEKYNKKLNKLKPGEIVRIRPPGAKSLFLDPLYDTSKRPVEWREIAERNAEADHTAGTDKKILSILAQENQEVWRVQHGTRYKFDFSKQINWVRDFRFTGQVLKSVLRPPKMAKDAEGVDQWMKDAEGHWIVVGGLPSCICDDGRVRTHIYQTKETGRWSSARPPLQNLSKQREKDYKRILADDYRWALRSMLCAPEGYVLIEADYMGAELLGMAMMSGDEAMLDHCQRGQLSEEDPNYYDIHSSVAVLAFGLTCPPTKAGLEAAGLIDLRIVAKSVIFGVAYGRGAKAIALAAKEQGVKITVGEAQQIIDTLFEMYPKLEAFFDACKKRASEERCMRNAFGRWRRVPLTRDRKVIGDLERQLMNFPIQSMIADAVSRACDHLYEYREAVKNIPYKFALQIHDAILLLVPVAYVGETIKALQICMSKKVPIYPTDLNGRRLGTGPYYLGIDTDVYTHWGEKLKPGKCLELGFSPKYANWKQREGQWGKWVEDETTKEKIFKAA